MSYFDFRVTCIHRVLDGDTFDLEVDLGFHTRTAKRYRLAGIDTAEVWGSNAEEAGKIQRDWAEEWLNGVLEQGSLRVRTFPLNWDVPLSDGGFGRWAAIVYDVINMEFLSDAMASQGFEKQGLPLHVQESVKRIQDEMKAGMPGDVALELTASGELRPIEA